MESFYKKLSKLIFLTLHFWLVAILLGLLLSGCGGPARNAPPEPIVSQLQDQAKKAKMQEQLLTQMGKATLTGYRDYAVGPEDLLDITFFGQPDLAREIRVGGRGEITMPLVGVVPVAGLSPQEIERRLENLYKEGEFINNPQITLKVKEFRHQRVTVTGAVGQAGSYEMIGPRSLLEMLGKAGGLNEKAGDVVHIIRYQSASDLTKARKTTLAQPFSPGTETIVIDLRRLLMKGALDLNLPIQNGDVIHVPFAQSAYVLGAVNKPGFVPLKENLTVSQAVALAGGQQLVLASNQITVLRFDDQGQRLTIPVNLGRVVAGSETDPVLQENDVVYVQENIIRRFFFDFKNMIPGSFGASAPIL
jgi:polysaccharide export outer membrane protein